MKTPASRNFWQDLRIGLRTLKVGVLSFLVQGTEQASLWKYKIQLAQMDHQLQDCYRDIGERVISKLSDHADRSLEESEFNSDRRLQELLKTAARLEQEKKKLLEEMEEMQ